MRLVSVGFSTRDVVVASRWREKTWAADNCVARMYLMFPLLGCGEGRRLNSVRILRSWQQGLILSFVPSLIFHLSKYLSKSWEEAGVGSSRFCYRPACLYCSKPLQFCHFFLAFCQFLGREMSNTSVLRLFKHSMIEEMQFISHSVVSVTYCKLHTCIQLAKMK